MSSGRGPVGMIAIAIFDDAGPHARDSYVGPVWPLDLEFAGTQGLLHGTDWMTFLTHQAERTRWSPVAVRVTNGHLATDQSV